MDLINNKTINKTESEIGKLKALALLCAKFFLMKFILPLFFTSLFFFSFSVGALNYTGPIEEISNPIKLQYSFFKGSSKCSKYN